MPSNVRKYLDLGEAQVALLHERPVKGKNKFLSVVKTADGHTFVRIHKIILTDCTCMNLETGEKRDS